MRSVKPVSWGSVKIKDNDYWISRNWCVLFVENSLLKMSVVTSSHNIK